MQALNKFEEVREYGQSQRDVRSVLDMVEHTKTPILLNFDRSYMVPTHGIVRYYLKKGAWQIRSSLNVQEFHSFCPDFINSIEFSSREKGGTIWSRDEEGDRQAEERITLFKEESERLYRWKSKKYLPRRFNKLCKVLGVRLTGTEFYLKEVTVEFLDGLRVGPVDRRYVKEIPRHLAI